MATLKEKIVSFDIFCKEVENLIFGYENIDHSTLKEFHDELIEKAKLADDLAKELFLSFGISEGEFEEIREKSKFSSDEMKETIKETTTKYIIEKFQDQTIYGDGYCLKEKLVGKAVQMVNNDDMLGFISDLVDGSSRFVMVDFGDTDGAVKIDIEELSFG